MVVKRIDPYTVLVDKIMFEFNEQRSTYISFDGYCTDEHIAQLNLFLRTESPESEEEYDEFFKYLAKLNKLLNEIGICSVQ